MNGFKLKNGVLIILLSIFILPFSLFADVKSAESEPVAVVLGGGGARGAYQIGVWKALRELNVEIGGVYGVSVGAINGAVMAMNDYETAEKLWLDLEKSNVMQLSDAMQRIMKDEYTFDDIVEAVKNFFINDGISVRPLKELLEASIDEQAVRAGNIDYGLLTYSLSEFSEKYMYIEDIPDGELVDYIMASANLPVFQPLEIDGREYLDGGFYRNLPVDMVDQRRFSKVIIVSLDMYSLYDVFDYISDYSDYSFETVFIKPEDNTVSLLDFDPDNAKKLIESGYNDCIRIFGEG